ncbi:PQQ-dependent sugar dehydrogenase [Cyanobacterium sp. IPPAS B-1200]|uniref:PQQ-dependent sugar dehydrogenase n=1 Tax=Cyanobacterium sp. IPPAS B-1200 TaxID=1562720 RepID=UPI00085277BD|nr:sorbosone dehydrogenase family protein [Cyanobacterium sp. IPPAS B-1200]OEJ78773.1 sorbosone dehydrogenase [Cyanobacterium sp. IPPAS B-1200]
MMKLKYLLPLILLTLGACNLEEGEQVALQSSNNSNNTNDIPVLSTNNFNPEPIIIDIEKLPEPFETNSVSAPAKILPIPSERVFNVPEGFEVNVYAEGINNPRWLHLTPEGDVLVTETRDNRITRLQDTNNDGVADQKSVFADSGNGLDIPFGMAFTDDYFFLGNHNGVRRYGYTNGQNQLEGQGELIALLPGGGYNQHWTRNVMVSPTEDKLYVSIGSRSNNDVEELPRASIQTMDFDGDNQETFASGLRNPVGLDFHPLTNRLYTTVNERDGLGDNLVPDYFTSVQEGGFYGWPYSYFTPELLDPRHTDNSGESINPDLVSRTIMPEVLIQSHSAALGMAFYDGDTFPEKYQNGAFVAFRGSWNRREATGYKLAFIPFDENNEPRGYYEDFLTGFLTDSSNPSTWGRPVGVLVLDDGSLLFTEEANDVIYRVQYVGK